MLENKVTSFFDCTVPSASRGLPGVNEASIEQFYYTSSQSHRLNFVTFNKTHISVFTLHFFAPGRSIISSTHVIPKVFCMESLDGRWLNMSQVCVWFVVVIHKSGRFWAHVHSAVAQNGTWSPVHVPQHCPTCIALRCQTKSGSRPQHHEHISYNNVRHTFALRCQIWTGTGPQIFGHIKFSTFITLIYHTWTRIGLNTSYAYHAVQYTVFWHIRHLETCSKILPIFWGR